LFLGSLLMWSAGSAFSDGGNIITTFAGSGSPGFTGDGGPAASAQLNFPTNIASDGAGNIYISDFGNNRIRKVTAGGAISTFAGNGTGGYSGDTGPATSAQIYQPEGLAVDAAGNLYISDAGNNRVRKVTLGGVITTVVGTGARGYAGDGGPATSAQISQPEGLAVDANGNLYIADSENNCIRKVTAGGVISTIAGTGTAGYGGDGGPAMTAQVSFPLGVSMDTAGNLYVADTNNNRIRKVTKSGIISTVAGTGVFGYTGDGGAAALAQLSQPEGLEVDAAGNLYIADTFNNRVRKVTADGVIGTVAGSGTAGYSGDGSAATSSQISFPLSVAVDSGGNLYISDSRNNRIRRIAAVPGALTRAGSYAQVASGGGWKTTMTLINSSAVNVDAQIDLYADSGSPMTMTLAFQPSASIITASSFRLTLSPNESIVVETEPSGSSVAAGWADVQASRALSGYSIFRFSLPGFPDSEGTAPLDSRLSSSVVMPYDNTNGRRTGLALANQASTPATITAILFDQNGDQLTSSQIDLPAFGHSSFFAEDRFPQAANQLGIIQLQSTGNVTGVGLLFSQSGSFTSVPISR